ncbi:hypothetical protein [Streptomyces sioyaensis]|uniref:hypothetical protein n=1 Tax=Streptomyces sioyaensis TaxID=67364 RepID=UPI003790B0E2
MSSSTTVHTARRRTLRIAVAALAAASGLTLTACSGSDAADAKSAGHTNTSSAAAESTASGWSGVQTSDAKAGAADKQSGKQLGSVHAANGGRAASPVRTQRLADGISKAEIYQLGDQHYRAKIVARGSVLATLETNQHDAGLDANGIYIVLSNGGVISAHE